MLRRWLQISPKERLIFLMLFAVLLPTLILLVVQFYSLSDLSEKAKAAFAAELRQNLQKTEETMVSQTLGEGEKMLQNFSEKHLETWNREAIKAELLQILRDNPNISAAFAFSGIRNDLSYTAFATGGEYHEFADDPTTRNKTQRDELFAAPEEEDIILSFLAAMEADPDKSSFAPYLTAQSRCQKCTLERQNSPNRSYIFRPFSNPREVIRFRLVGVTLKNEFVTGDYLPGLLRESATSSFTDEDLKTLNLAVFDDRQNLIFSNAQEAAKWDDFEVRAPLAKIFPNWTLAASYQNNRIEDLSNAYFRRNLLLMVLVTGLVVIGVLLMLHNTEREMRLAESKSAFVSNVSHELKTPLSLIRLFAETLESGRVSKPEKTQEYYRIISSETRRLTQLINNILDFAAIEAGRKEYNFAPDDLNAAVQEVVQNYRYVLENAGFEIKQDYDSDLPLFSFDRDAVGQAVLNLLNNACKYSAAEKFVEISTGRRDEGQAVIKVTDRGIGIAQREQERIFEKFYRSGGASDVHNAKGSGLGLSLVKHIVQAHGGRVAVSSRLGGGSTFTIFLPLKLNDGY